MELVPVNSALMMSPVAGTPATVPLTGMRKGLTGATEMEGLSVYLPPGDAGGTGVPGLMSRSRVVNPVKGTETGEVVRRLVLPVKATLAVIHPSWAAGLAAEHDGMTMPG